MAITILKLTKGNPNGTGKPEDYEFEPITLDGDAEQTFLAEIDEYRLEFVTEYWVDHDEYGRYLDDTSISYNALTDVLKFCFVHDGHFAGVAFTDTIHFAHTGKKIGNAKSYNSWWVNDRRMDNAVSNCTLVKAPK